MQWTCGSLSHESWGGKGWLGIWRGMVLGHVMWLSILCLAILEKSIICPWWARGSSFGVLSRLLFCLYRNNNEHSFSLSLMGPIYFLLGIARQNDQASINPTSSSPQNKEGNKTSRNHSFNPSLLHFFPIPLLYGLLGAWLSVAMFFASFPSGMS